MKIIKYGTPRQLLYLTCHACGCEFEIFNEEIWQNIDDKEVRVRCPCCGVYIYDLRDKIVVKDGCLGNRCAKLTCDGHKWEVGLTCVTPHWITHGENQDVFECSECHEEIWDEKTPYCPYCGVKMEETDVSN